MHLQAGCLQSGISSSSDAGIKCGTIPLGLLFSPKLCPHYMYICSVAQQLVWREGREMGRHMMIHSYDTKSINQHTITLYNKYHPDSPSLVWTKDTHLKKVVDGVVNAQYERSHSDHVRRPRHHHQRYRDNVVHNHLPEILYSSPRSTVSVGPWR